ncbi:glycosyltransferase family 2 protein [Bariatricus sp. HCP3S3_E12]|uniref:glycosyltransferase family 2 protein n=1 Tax=Bariatricus sp. HCP3S3_E12 TaxID=3438906 RepID=UPI003F8B0F5A
MGKISVIIPTHNRADLLPRAVKSIQNQTMPVDEIIIVSDGSTDNTDEVVKKMQREDDRIQLISYHPGHNGNYARNQGLGRATGEYIAFLDDDDEWLPQKTELQMKVFEDNQKVGLVYAAQHCIFLDTDTRYDTKPSWKGDLSKQIFIHNDIGTPSQVIIKKSVLEEAGNFDLELGALQDYDLWIRCCQITEIGFVAEPCINYYNMASSNQVSANTEKYIKARRYMADKYKYITDTFSPDLRKQIDSIVEMRIAQRCLRNGKKKDARQFALTSLKMRFSKQAVALYIASFFSYKTVLKVRGKFKY